MFKLKEEDIKEYQAIMLSDYGVDLTNAQAEEYGLWLLGLCEVLYVKKDKNEKS